MQIFQAPQGRNVVRATGARRMRRRPTTRASTSSAAAAVEGRLLGVMDDRGKYIYISLEEMEVVDDYIKREGRVSPRVACPISYTEYVFTKTYHLIKRQNSDKTSIKIGAIFQKQMSFSKKFDFVL
ncbi:uncharacterized protein [Spinacia oleracea]|uniref:Uncharacterized protein n=1 Tax=Spinacia oleracea TaxID=3562 RepID=A0ABM3QIN8_SPIOL|nr:uncharacterized protein LOC130459730 [Spinacia oleracea]